MVYVAGLKAVADRMYWGKPSPLDPVLTYFWARWTLIRSKPRSAADWSTGWKRVSPGHRRPVTH